MAACNIGKLTQTTDASGMFAKIEYAGALVGRSAVTGHDTAQYGTGYLARGNLTALKLRRDQPAGG